VGETWTYRATRSVTAAEFAAGAPLVNMATADSPQTDPATATATVLVTPPNVAPAVVAARSSLAGNQFLDTITAQELAIDDADSDGWMYVVTGLPKSGTLLIDGVAIVNDGSSGPFGAFFQADLDGGRVQYLAGQSAATPAPRTALADTFTFTVFDGVDTSAEATFTIDLAPYDAVQTAPRFGVYRGGAGRDYQQGTAGSDPMAGAAGHDTMAGNGGADAMSGGDGNDRLYGGAGRDALSGDRGDDFLEGGADADLLYAGAGHDRLRGGACDGDRAWGGAGNDTFVFRPGDGKDSVEDFSLREADVLDLRGFGYVSFTHLKDTGGAITTTRGGDTILKLTAADWLSIENVRATQLQESDFLFA
jgi:Ca2+-binding RTX toxin-like protein